MKLYDHQKRIVEEDKKKIGLFLGTGSGKTRTALYLARGKILVICPKTQKEDQNWERENKTIGVSLTTISKETFRRDHAILPHFETVIVDEAHTCLGVTPNTRQRKKITTPKTSQLFEALELFIERTQPERLYLCTATIMRSPMTVWGAGKLLGKKWDFFEWRNAFYVKLRIPGREIYQAKIDDVTKDLLAKTVKSIGYVGRLEDYVDMPPQVFKTDFLELTPEQKKRSKEMDIEFPEPLVRSLKKHMIENGVLNGDEYSKAEVFNNAKIDKILEYSIEFPQLIVFARYTSQINQIAEAIKKTGKKVFVLTGETKERGKMLAEAQNCSEYAFICQSSVSAGWEINACPTVIFASLDYSIVNYIQAIGRISRINNPKRNLYIHLVVKGGIDHQVYKTVVETKMDFHLAQFV